MPQIFPWLTLVSIIWLQSISSTNTDFPAYSSTLKSRLGITQLQLNNLAVSYWQYFLLQALAGNSICWFNTTCYVAAMRSFAVDDGFVIGLSTSYAGLSAKLYVALAQLIAGRDLSSKSIYLLLNCFVPLGLSLLTAPFLKETTPVRSGAASSLLAVFVIAGATGVYVVVESIFLSSEHSILMPIILLIMVGLVAAVPLFKALERVQDCDEVQVGAENRKRGFGGGSVEEGEGVENEENLREEGCIRALQKSVKRVEFWLYFLVYLCGGTVGLVYANNLGQIAESRNVNEDVLLSISSSFTFFGRLSSAPLSLFTTSRRKYIISRPGLVAILMVPISSSFLLLLSSSKTCLFISTGIIGMCTGAITSVAVSMTSDLFGPENFSVDHNLIVANIPIGSLLFGYIAALVYDKGADNKGVCIGVVCYRTTFITWGSICSLGTILSVVLYIRTRGYLLNT
ncbi:protein NUCLEAR FUSION DEFECTIVE 4-like [Asparagus officinalis]|uniref:protein NUCLEAR FUSION DEFECTIVE 4-like n=1 Tax=Asparagus officinalis TaxID=4686 RepID=UPI00098E6805|nr:protein NUCLEAR FUSION DEFECTIVE 4-like [Asparagus officinalis]